MNLTTKDTKNHEKNIVIYRHEFHEFTQISPPVMPEADPLRRARRFA